MNIINLKDLEIRLSENYVSEKEGFQYLLANWLVFGMIAFGAVDKNYDNPGVMLMLLVIPSMGLLIGYFANQKGDGKDFLKRFIAVHWILGIRFFALLIAGIVLLDLLTDPINSEAIRGWISGLFCIAIGVGFYYSLSRTLRKIANWNRFP